ncbi:methyl jasmonate esterase 1-like isoform X2 [Lycium barbarum]|uniref:methyl jasmonate esterase 1-like isoform X2 n=1 Tax=Lycium barbarum TaxID=112863 RepID=UPI00293E18DE|nr:methyl jasmonate esterase 1-like isoform X2 [Lycium barbarum]
MSIYACQKEKMMFLILCFVLLFLVQVGYAKGSEKQSPKLSKHFVLVHGSCHGAWSWYKLMALIRSSGHNVTAIDLAASGINNQQPRDIPSISQYFKPLMNFMTSLPPNKKVVIVGHSLGGLAIARAMETFPEKISASVFISAAMPGPTLNVSTLMKVLLRQQNPLLDNRYTYDNGPNNPPTTFNFGQKYLADYVYHLSPIEDLALATTLMRPLYLYTDEDMSKELKLSHKNYGSVSRVFILSNEDKVVTRDLQEWMIERNPPDEVEVIEGSDHMVMMSKPVELFVHFLHIAKKYY